MKYTEEIYSTLSHGGFISSNSLSPAVRRYYDAIEEELTDYYEYYKGIGFYLESGNGYYFFELFSDKKGFEEIVDKLINELKTMGFIEYEDEDEGTWKVLTAFHYIEELVDCINITQEGQNEIPE